MGSFNSTMLKSESQRPLVFHRLHGKNIQLSPDWRRARRLRGFEHAVTLSDRPVSLNRYINVRVTATDPTWRGALRVGLTSQHPGNLTRDHIPACSCPGLAERDEFWVAPVPEALTTLQTEMYFYVTTTGDLVVSRTVDKKRRAWEEQVLMCKIPVNKPLWLVMDVYGQTTEVELFEPKTAIMIIQNAPDGGASQHVASKLRDAEDPLTENAINTALLLQEASGSGAGPSTKTEAAFPPPPRLPAAPKVAIRNTDMTVQVKTPKEEIPPSAAYEKKIVASPVAVESHDTADACSDREKKEDSGEESEEEEECDVDTSVLSSGDEQDDDAVVAPSGMTEHVASPSECTVCLDAAVDCTLYRCGHMCMCLACATNMKENAGGECPVCREPIEDIIKTYMT